MEAWNFVILAEYSNIGGPGLVAVRMEYLFVYKFWYWELLETCLEEKESIILIIFSFGGAFDVGGWGLVWLVLFTSLRLQIPWTYDLPTLHIYSTSNRRRVYNDYKSNFKELLERNHSFTIHERNIQYLATKAYKVKNGLSPVIMNDVFQFAKKPAYEFRSGNHLQRKNIKIVHFCSDSIKILGAKI